jgi:DNA-binding NarL/FixJ family response regulator
MAQPSTDEVALVGRSGPLESIAELLDQADVGFRSANDVDVLLSRSRRHSPSLVLLCADESAGELSAVVGSIAQRFEQARVVVICGRVERWGVRAALIAGAVGVVLSNTVESALIPCLRAVQADQICVPRGNGRQIEPPALSAREKQVLGLVVMGFMNGQIAEQLFLAESTVKSHLSSAFGKLGVRSRNEATKLILDPERGFGMGILALGGEPVEPRSPERT